jgi:TrmH family RNA methyltransferase
MEGPHLLDALLSADLLPREIYFQPTLLQRTPEGRTLLTSIQQAQPPFADIPLFEVNERVAEVLSDAQTSQGVVAVLAMQDFQPERLQTRRSPAIRPALLILDDLADPGNMGTILRTALAADVHEVLLTPRCVDIFSPKVTRSAAGAHVALPVWRNVDWPTITQRIQQHCGGRLLLAEAHSTQFYFAEDLVLPFALVIGNEAHGPSAEARKLATRTISIPLAEHVESLNAAMAAGILLFEAVRQKHTHS